MDDVCRDMDLGETGVWRWLAQAHEEATGRSGIGKLLTIGQQGIRQLDAREQAAGPVATQVRSHHLQRPRATGF